MSGISRMKWSLSNRADPLARALADRHYSRQKPGTTQFVPPGRCLVLYTQARHGAAYWVTSWPFAQYVKHAWAGAWICSAFRNESRYLSSDLILQALAATRAFFGEPPAIGLVTFVDDGKVRDKANPGRCFIAAGGVVVGETKSGLVAIQFPPAAIPQARAARGTPRPCADLFGAVA